MATAGGEVGRRGVTLPKDAIEDRPSSGNQITKSTTMEVPIFCFPPARARATLPCARSHTDFHFPAFIYPVARRHDRLLREQVPRGRRPFDVEACVHQPRGTIPLCRAT